MSFDWTHYLFLAENLHKGFDNPPTEAMLRSCVSRAYYAAFCHARNYLINERDEIIPTDGSAHNLVKRKFSEAESQTDSKIAENLNRLRLDRNRADYDDSIDDLGSTSDFAIILCQSIFLKIRELQQPS